MKTVVACLYLLIFIPLLAVAQKDEEAEIFYNKAMSQINAKHVRWVKSTALTVNKKDLSETEISKMALNHLGGIRNTNIDALVFLVLMEAAKSAQEDLKSIMAGVKAINDQKKEIREALNDLNNKSTNVTKEQLDSFKLIINKSQVLRKANRTTNVKSSAGSSGNRSISQKDINTIKTELNKEFSSLSEMVDKLQMAMDRRSKMMSMVSNLMKKISDTQSTIIQNLK